MEIVELVRPAQPVQKEQPPRGIMLQKKLAGTVLLSADGVEREFQVEHVAGGVLRVGLHATALRFPVSLSASGHDPLRCSCHSLNMPCSGRGRSTSADLFHALEDTHLLLRVQSSSSRFVSGFLFRSWGLREFVRVVRIDIAPLHIFAGPPVAKNQRATPKEKQSLV